jgi:hypothetical protein
LGKCVYDVIGKREESLMRPKDILFQKWRLKSGSSENSNPYLLLEELILKL